MVQKQIVAVLQKYNSLSSRLYNLEKELHAQVQRSRAPGANLKLQHVWSERVIYSTAYAFPIYDVIHHSKDFFESFVRLRNSAAQYPSILKLWSVFATRIGALTWSNIDVSCVHAFFNRLSTYTNWISTLSELDGMRVAGLPVSFARVCDSLWRTRVQVGTTSMVSPFLHMHAEDDAFFLLQDENAVCNNATTYVHDDAQPFCTKPISNQSRIIVCNKQAVSFVHMLHSDRQTLFVAEIEHFPLYVPYTDTIQVVYQPVAIFAQSHKRIWMHEYVTVMGEYLKRKFHALLNTCSHTEYSPLIRDPSVHSRWRSMHEKGIAERKRILAEPRPNLNALVESICRSSQIITCSARKHVRHYLQLAGGRFPKQQYDSSRCCVYLWLNLLTNDTYAGIFGATHTKTQVSTLKRTRWRCIRRKRKRNRPNVRVFGDRVREHLRHMINAQRLSCKGRRSARGMYSTMASTGIEQWVCIQTEFCLPAVGYQREKWWIRRLKKPLNSRLYCKGTQRYQNFLRWRLQGPEHFEPHLQREAQSVISSLRNNKSLPTLLSLLLATARCIKVVIWNQLFRKTAELMLRYTKVELQRQILLRLPLPAGALKQFAEQVRQMICHSGAPRSLKDWYTGRIEICPARLPSVGDLLFNKRVDYTPELLRQSITNSCPCGILLSKFPQPSNPIKHFVIRSPNPNIHEIFPQDIVAILQQNMKNSTLPTEATFNKELHEFSSKLARVLLPPGKARSAFARLIWDRGRLFWESLPPDVYNLQKSLSSKISQIKNHYPHLVWGELDKNNGDCWGMCRCLHAQLFYNNFILSPRYTVMQTFECVQEARDHLSAMLRESLNNFQFGKLLCTPQQSQPPSGYMLFKDKSKDWLGEYKIRPIISHYRHMARKVASTVSRALSVLVKVLARSCGNLEFYEMQQAKGFFHRVEEGMLRDSEPWVGLELDLEDMYLNIDKREVEPSFQYMLDAISSFRGHYTRYRKTTGVAVSKDCNSEDRLGCGSETYFVNVSVETIAHYLKWELYHNCFFVVGSYLFHQHKGIPMGGKLSGQISSMVLMCKEMKWSKIGLFECQYVRLARYKDNIYIFGRASLLYWLTVALLAMFQHIYQMPVQFEQYGPSITILEVVVSCLRHRVSVTLKPNDKTRWPDRWSPNVHSTLQSLVPGIVHKCFWWQMGSEDIQHNIQLTKDHLGRRYPESWWKCKFIYGICKRAEPTLYVCKVVQDENGS